MDNYCWVRSIVRIPNLVLAPKTMLKLNTKCYLEKAKTKSASAEDETRVRRQRGLGVSLVSALFGC